MPDHLLPPRFFAMPSDVPFEDGDRFEVLWYAQADVFTLVHWCWYSDAPPLRPIPGIPASQVATEGESLYRGDDFVAWDWYGLTLGEPTELKALLAHKSSDPRARVDSAMGNYGLSPTLAVKLRSPEARISFKFN